MDCSDGAVEMFGGFIYVLDGEEDANNELAVYYFDRNMHFLGALGVALTASLGTGAVTVPSTPPSSAQSVDKSILSVSLEFFAFPGYTQLEATNNCLANIATLRGAQPAVRIGGTTQ